MDAYIMATVYVLAALFGLCVGSFLNVVIYRFPLKMSLAYPASHCTSCDYVLKWYDNIPVLSYLMLGGRCRSCKERISPRYMLVELANGVLWVAAVYLFWESSIVFAVSTALVSSVLICIFFIDLEHMLIYNRFTIAVAVCGAALMFFDSFAAWYHHLIGAAVGGALFLALYYGSILILKKEGLGFGDVKLAAAAGLLLGWQRLILAILVASVSASILLLILRRLRKDEEGKEYPFAPFLVAGFLFALFFGAGIINWYVGILVG